MVAEAVELFPCADVTDAKRISRIVHELRNAKGPFIDPRRCTPDSERGFPTLDKLTISPHLSINHPLAEYFHKSVPLTASDLSSIFHSKHVNVAITGFHNDGRVPAAFYQPTTEDQADQHTRYDRSQWNRDAMVVEAALRRTGHFNEAYSINRLLWHTIGDDAALRANLLSFRNRGNTLERLRRGEKIIPIKWSLGDPGRLHIFEDWNHIQLDAYWETLRGPFRNINELQLAKALGKFPAHIDPSTLSIQAIDPLHGKTDEHILVSAAYAFFDTLRAPHEGIWESYAAPGGTHALLVALSAMDEMVDFFERNGEKALPHRPRDGFSFIEELYAQREYVRSIIKSRVPERGYARERPERPYDMAMLFAAYPFTSSDSSLNTAQIDTLLRTGYDHCMRPEGWIRWSFDTQYGLDTYVGPNYMNDPAEHKRGEFAKFPTEWWAREGAATLIPNRRFLPARWTLYDPVYSGCLYLRYIESNGANIEAFLRADRHLKRALSQITKSEYEIIVRGKDNQRFVVPKGVLPEAWTCDYEKRTFVPCHNGALLMSHALLALALEKAVEATALWESERGRNLREIMQVQG